MQLLEGICHAKKDSSRPKYRYGTQKQCNYRIGNKLASVSGVEQLDKLIGRIMNREKEILLIQKC